MQVKAKLACIDLEKRDRQSVEEENILQRLTNLVARKGNCDLRVIWEEICESQSCGIYLS